MTEQTLCVECRHLYVPNKSDRWPWFQCMAMKARMNFVTGTIDPPYRYCRHVNFGDCDKFESGPNDYQPRPTPAIQRFYNDEDQPKGE